MKITVSQLRKIIREEVQRNISEAKFNVGDRVEEKGTDSGWWEILELIPDNRTGKTVAKLKMFQPVGGRTPITHVTTDKLGKVKESLSYPGSSPLKDGGVVNSESGEILDMDAVPPQYLDHIEVDEMGYTTLPNDKFEELRGELKRSSAGKPKKQWKSPYEINRMKMGEAKGIGTLHGVRSPRAIKLKLGDIYRNDKGHQISIEFLDDKFAGWELLARGKSKGLDGSVDELRSALLDGGFEFDRNETVY